MKLLPIGMRISLAEILYFFSKKMILEKNRYKTYNKKLFIIIKILKIRKYYLKNCNYKIYIFIHNQNICLFIDIKFWYLKTDSICSKIFQILFLNSISLERIRPGSSYLISISLGDLNIINKQRKKTVFFLSPKEENIISLTIFSKLNIRNFNK